MSDSAKRYDKISPRAATPFTAPIRDITLQPDQERAVEENVRAAGAFPSVEEFIDAA